MTADELATRIRGASQRRSGAWVGHCPAHDDQRESLSWDDGRQGALVVTCHAGCRKEAIARALGLDLSTLLNGAGPPPAAAPRRPAQIVATYDYHDATGALIFQVLRYAPKTFRQRRPDGHGGWVWSIGDTERVVYRLPQLAGHHRAWWVEGEKDADRLAALGLPATTSPGGASAWRPEYAAQLHAAGIRELVILPDNDDPGRAYALQVAAAATAQGIRALVLSLPGLEPKGDVSDWLGAGGTLADLERLAGKLEPWRPAKGPTIELVGDSYYATLGEGVIEYAGIEEHRGDLFAHVIATNTATGAKYWSKLNLAAGRSRSELAREIAERCPGAPWRALLDESAHEVACRFMEGSDAVELTGPPLVSEATWWIPGWVPMNETSLLFGAGASGKSLTALAIALASLRPAALGGPGGWTVRPLRGVLYLDWESNQETLHRRWWRLSQAEGITPPSNLYYLKMDRPLAQSLPKVTKQIRQHAPEAIIVDSWVPAMGTAARNDADATAALMASIRTLGLTCLGIAHVTKAALEGTVGATPFGSIMNTNLARSTIEASGESTGNTLHVSYRHAKVNDEAYQRSRGLCFTFSDGQIAVESDAPDITKAPLPEQIRAALASGNKTGHEVADEIGQNVESVTRILRRYENRTFIRLEGGQPGRGRKSLWGLINKSGRREA